MANIYSQMVLKKLKRYLIASVVTAYVVLISVTYLVIEHNRSSEVEKTGLSLRTLAVILSKESDATLTLASTVLESLANKIKNDPAYSLQNAYAIHLALGESRVAINFSTGRASFSHLFVIGPDGYNVANTVSHPAKRVAVHDRSYYQFHKNSTANELHISQPMYSKVTGERVVFLTRRLTTETNEFNGVIGVQLKLSHFDRLYETLKMPPGGSVTLLRSDGRGIFRYPMVEAFLDTPVAGHPIFQQMMSEESGYLYSKNSPYDNADRLVGFQVSDRYPVLNAITVTEETALESWRASSLVLVVLSGFGGLVLIAISVFAYRQLDNVARATDASTRDPLTGLWNRRAYDAHLESEWNRAQRKNDPISIMYIDIDHFKKYNDRYGHYEGDACLKRIARCLAKNLSRSGEMVARYGGEEFIALLPDSDLQAARTVAERILASVCMLEIPHEDSPVHSFVTVSIGIAATHATKGMSADKLKVAADNALYRAKDLGRNQLSAINLDDIDSKKQESENGA